MVVIYLLVHGLSLRVNSKMVKDMEQVNLFSAMVKASLATGSMTPLGVTVLSNERMELFS
jgi:hypothetical protein